MKISGGTRKNLFRQRVRANRQKVEIQGQGTGLNVRRLSEMTLPRRPLSRGHHGAGAAGIGFRNSQQLFQPVGQ